MSVALGARRLAAAHWALLAALALFLLVAAFVFDDYGLSVDEHSQRLIGEAPLNYLAGEGDRALDWTWAWHDRNYGAVFEAPLVLLLERVLALEDSRDIYLGRHFLTHLFFLTGGAFCYLIVLRMFASKPLALIAMILFLLHPRLYAHSFINTKDIPFLVMFMVALYLSHRAFRRDTLGAFVLCGVGVGLLVNLRILGVILLIAVLALRGLDLPFAGSGRERRRVLLTGGAFALAAVLTYYAVLPVLWTDPIGRFAELVRTLSVHPNEAFDLFRGERLHSRDGLPFDYVPVWVGITTPPATLLLALAGAVALVWRATRHPGDVLRNGQLRFGLLLLALPVATVVGIVALESNIYDGWRQLYFLYAPLLLLAILGLHWLASLLQGRWMRVGGYVLAGMGVAVTLASIARIHPMEDLYYTVLTDRAEKNYLVSRYETHYWRHIYYKLFQEIQADHPEHSFLLAHPEAWRQNPIIDNSDKKNRAIFGKLLPPGIYSVQSIPEREYTVTIYNNALVTLEWVRLASPQSKEENITRAMLTGESIETVLAGNPIVRSFFDVYHDGNVLIFVREDYDCIADTPPMFIHVYPVYPDDLSDEVKQYGFENMGFFFWERGISLDGRCVAISRPLPSWPIASIHLGQYRFRRGSLWDVRFSLVRPDSDSLTLTGEPVARSVFDVYRDGDALIYVRDGCTGDEADTAFGLHVYPVFPDDLPDDRKQYGFEGRDFRLWTHGGWWKGRCTTVVPLPDYPIASIQTGQYDETGRLWWVEFALPDG